MYLSDELFLPSQVLGAAFLLQLLTLCSCYQPASSLIKLFTMATKIFIHSQVYGGNLLSAGIVPSTRITAVSKTMSVLRGLPLCKTITATIVNHKTHEQTG